MRRPVEGGEGQEEDVREVARVPERDVEEEVVERERDRDADEQELQPVAPALLGAERRFRDGDGLYGVVVAADPVADLEVQRRGLGRLQLNLHPRRVQQLARALRQRHVPAGPERLPRSVGAEEGGANLVYGEGEDPRGPLRRGGAEADARPVGRRLPVLCGVQRRDGLESRGVRGDGFEGRGPVSHVRFQPGLDAGWRLARRQDDGRLGKRKEEKGNERQNHVWDGQGAEVSAGDGD